MSSPTPLEADAVLDAIIANLLADTAPGGVATLTGNRIYRDVAPSVPSPTVYPIVTVSLLSSVDFEMADGSHEWAHVTILTKVTDKGSNYQPTLAIAARIATRLSAIERVQQGDVYIVKVRRIEVIPQPSDYVTIGGSTARYVYHNQSWFTEASPAS